MVIPIAQIVLQYNDLVPIRLYHSISGKSISLPKRRFNAVCL